MPKDEFERLERRWRERPLFLDKPSRKPLWTMVLLVLAAGALLGLAAIGPPHPGALFDRLTTAAPSSAPSDRTAQAAPARLRIPIIPNGQ